MEKDRDWLALAVGNSRLHWGWFKHHSLVEIWHTEHLQHSVRSHQLPHLLLHSKLVQQDLLDIPVYLASVVTNQTKHWHDYHKLNKIALKDIELANIYPTMGVDRALAVWGAVSTYKQACLVIDGGTALTFSGVDRQRKLVGGAILPGLRSQLLSLKQKTSTLPEIELPERLPPRWALDTDMAIASGILYAAIAGVYSYILDWLRQFPQSQVIFTGGDGQLLARFLHQQYPDLECKAIIDPNLIFTGIQLVYKQQNTIRE